MGYPEDIKREERGPDGPAGGEGQVLESALSTVWRGDDHTMTQPTSK
jgi:hypothetical protein